jgi:hypothetical protein
VVIAVLALLAKDINWNVWGDPHLATLDGFAYDLQSVGEFHLLEVPDYEADVQARFAAQGTNVSSLRAVSTEINDTGIEISSSGELRVDGEPVTMEPGGFYDLGEGAAIMRDQTSYAVLWPGYDDRLMMMVRGQTVGFRVPKDVKTTGLLGNANGDHEDDLALRDGTALPTSTSDATLHGQYADSWRITQDESLFSYPGGGSTDTYTDRSFPKAIVTPGDFPESEIAAATATCEAAGVAPGPQFEACVLDLLVTGDDAYAADSSLVTDVLIDRDAATFDDSGNLSEDFEGTVAPNFASGRYSEDPATTRVAGPLFDTPGYRLTARTIPRHESVRMRADLYAYGDIGADEVTQSLAIKVDGWNDVGRIDFDTAGGPVLAGGLTGTVTEAGSGTTAGGTSYIKYAVDVTLPSGRSALDVEFFPSNFRGVLGTSLAIDNIALSLAVPPTQTFPVELPLTVPSAQAPREDGAGDLETPGAQDDYTFTLTEPASLVLDPSGCTRESSFALINTGSGEATGLGCEHVTTAEMPAGSYRLEVTAAVAYRTYSFKLAAVPDPQTFDYTVGDTVADGVPASGAGNLETSASVDRYLFTVPDGGQTLVYAGLDRNSEWLQPTLTNTETGDVVNTLRHAWTYDLAPGNYRLDFRNDFPQKYTFSLFEPPQPQEFEYTLGDTVSDGVPAAGAGNLETVASVDRYNFTIPAGGTTVAFDREWWIPAKLTDAVTGEVISNDLRQGDQHALDAGAYQLELGPRSATTYTFALVEVPAMQTFDYVIGDLVSDGVPAPGAGNLETVASIDRYRFTVPAGGTKVAYATDTTILHPTLTNTDTGQVVDAGLSQGEEETLVAGTYRLDVGPDEYVDTYEFMLINGGVPAPQTFDYTLGDTVSNGVPAAGAGNLETRLSIDRYRFTVPAGGAEVFYEDISDTGLYYTVTDLATGDQVPNYNHRFQLAAGTYQIAFGKGQPGSFEPGTYSFKLGIVREQEFDYTLGDTVSDGVPGPGAGNLETTVARDAYLFTIPEGGLKVHVELPGSFIPYQITRVATGDVVANGYGTAQYQLAAGSYRIVFSHPGSGATPLRYTLRIYEVPPPDVFDYELGTTVSDGVPTEGAGHLETGASADHYNFTIPDGGGLSVQVELLDTVVRYVIVDVATGQQAASGYATSRHQLPAGDYQIRLTYSGGQLPFTYTLKIYEAPPPDVFDYQIGSTVSNGAPVAGAGNLEGGASVDHYLFTVPEGGMSLYVESRDAQLHQYQIYNVDTGQWAGYTGYTARHQLSAGRYRMEFAANGHPGTYSFAMHQAPDPETFDYALGETVSDGVPSPGAGNLESAGASDRYRFTVPAGGAKVKFEQLTGTTYATIRELAHGWEYLVDAYPDGQQLAAGDYELHVVARVNHEHGPYSFKMYVPEE